MKKLLFLLCAMMLLTACGQAAETTKEAVYVNITAEEAKTIMDTQEGYVILDARAQDEYDQGHIPGAFLIPDTEIKAKAEEILTEKDQLILVYCRSGRRSKLAAEALVELGYTNVKEFGGIDISSTVDGLMDCILPIAIAFGIVNNPTDRKEF